MCFSLRHTNELAFAPSHRFYAQNATLEHIERNVLVDDMKRRDREAKDRKTEAQMLDSLYQVSKQHVARMFAKLHGKNDYTCPSRSFPQSEKARELSLIRAEEEEKIATALARRQLEKDRKEKEIQQLREQSAELRELAEKIRIAKVNKERSLQLQAKATAKVQAAEYDEAFNKYIDEVDAAAEARIREHEARRCARREG